MNANATARGTHEPVDDRQLVSETGSVLLTGGSNAGRVRYLCRAARETHRDGRDVLFVAAGEGADRLRTALPEGIAIVECTPSESPEAPNVASVGSPGGLTGTSIPVSQFIEAAGPEPVVLIDSLSTLLVYADEGPLFRFLRTDALHARSAGGWLAVGMNAGAHDERTLGTFQQVFEHPERLGDDGVDSRDGSSVDG